MTGPERMRELSSSALARIAWWLAGLCVVGTISMQIVKHDWLPPTDSLSQYGVGKNGWVFSVAVGALGATSVTVGLLARALGRPLITTIMLGVGGAGFIIDGLVPADAAASHPTIYGHIHLVAAVFGVVLVPVAAVVLCWQYRSKTFPMVTIVVSVGCIITLILLLFAAADLALFGQSQEYMWALYQTIALIGTLIVLYLLRASLLVVDSRASIPVR
ncbi:MAG: DUF998 domain-containing protein [Antricoccus sp.]